MAKITGVGGMPMESWGQMFPWLERESGKKGYTVLGLHSTTSDYFTGSTREFMLNLRVDDLDGMLAELAKQDIKPVRTFPPEANGRFAHVPGPEGITLELWQPADPDPYDPGA